jgi:hypothetical protein
MALKNELSNKLEQCQGYDRKEDFKIRWNKLGRWLKLRKWVCRTYQRRVDVTTAIKKKRKWKK